LEFSVKPLWNTVQSYSRQCHMWHAVCQIRIRWRPSDTFPSQRNWTPVQCTSCHQLIHFLITYSPICFGVQWRHHQGVFIVILLI
jgi:hypothetical protein